VSAASKMEYDLKSLSLWSQFHPLFKVNWKQGLSDNVLVSTYGEKKIRKGWIIVNSVDFYSRFARFKPQQGVELQEVYLFNFIYFLMAGLE